MKQIELSAGTIEYQDTGGAGPALVLLHRLMMDASLWDGPIADLTADHRCIAPTLPLGAHRHAMRPGADLSLPGISRLVAELIDRLGVQDVTLVGKLPPTMFGLFMQQMRLRAVRRLPVASGWLTIRGDAATAQDSYTLIPLDQPARLAPAVTSLSTLAAGGGPRLVRKELYDQCRCPGELFRLLNGALAHVHHLGFSNLANSFRSWVTHS
jgi:hypothetical protein